MKSQYYYSRRYKAIDDFEPGHTSVHYGPAKKDNLADKLSNICISRDGNGESPFLFYSKGFVAHITVDADVNTDDKEMYDRDIQIEIMPPRRLPKELSDILKKKGFKEVKK
jgi:hypothetical protein